MTKAEIRAIEAFIAEQHAACNEASEAGRTFEADVHYGMEMGAMEALKRARRTRRPRPERTRRERL